MVSKCVRTYVEFRISIASSSQESECQNRSEEQKNPLAPARCLITRFGPKQSRIAPQSTNLSIFEERAVDLRRTESVLHLENRTP